MIGSVSPWARPLAALAAAGLLAVLPGRVPAPGRPFGPPLPPVLGSTGDQPLDAEALAGLPSVPPPAACRGLQAGRTRWHAAESLLDADHDLLRACITRIALPPPGSL